MGEVSFFFAGGGTGGHIYPALAVAEQVAERAPEASIHFLCSTRPIDRRVLDATSFAYTTLPATPLYFDPKRFTRFLRTFHRTYRQARSVLAGARAAVVIGTGGFVAAPVCLAGRKLGVPVAVINIDIVAGRANRLSARWAGEIFLQFAEAGRPFEGRRRQIHLTGCPLRASFGKPEPQRAVAAVGIEPDKKVLLITGASSGSAHINEAVGLLLDKLEAFSEGWQIVHLTGLENRESVTACYRDARISHKVLDYYDGMADLLAAADLVIGRSGAVSIAEYAAAGVPSICLPYPYHKDRHQYLNAGKLVEAGAAVIVEDVADPQARADGLWAKLAELMADDDKRAQMARACRQMARPRAAADIAERLIAMAQA